MMDLSVPSLLGLRRGLRSARERVLAFQDERLRRVVAHAYARVPYYRRLFDRAGLLPEDIRSRADLASIPITERRDLQSLPVADIVCAGMRPDRLIVHRTSGATGQPLTIYRTWREELLLRAFWLRTMHHLGLRVRDRRAGVGLMHTPSTLDALVRLLYAAGLYRSAPIDCLQHPRVILEQLKQYAPDVLGGFSGALSCLAPFMDADDRRAIRPRFIAAGGDVMTPLMRRQISAAFGAPVFELYGSHEFNLMAWQCKETGELHVCDDTMILEVLTDGRPARPGERGEVVGTSLRAFAMPFVRYRLGDVVTQGVEACRCGQPSATIREIQGRMIDYFVFRDGRLMHPYELAKFVVADHQWIQRYRLTQEREDRVLLELVPLAVPGPEELTWLEGRARAVLGADVEFQVMLVPRIDMEPNGKFRVSRSLVRSHYDGIEDDRV